MVLYLLTIGLSELFNPFGNFIGDCVVSAVSGVMDIS